jgi:hypothetical protein
MNAILTTLLVALIALILSDLWRKSRFSLLATWLIYFFFTGGVFFSATSAGELPIHSLVNILMFLVVQIFFLFILLGNFITERPLTNGIARSQAVATHIEQHGLTGSPVQKAYKAISVLTYTIGPLSLLLALFFGKRV